MLSSPSHKRRRNYLVGIGLVTLILLFDLRTMFANRHGPRYSYQSLPNFFETAESKTDPAGYDWILAKLAIIDRSYEENEDPDASDWGKLYKHIFHLNDNAEDGELYKVVFLLRHAEGEHNAAEKRYGTKDWNEKWAMMDGDGNGIVWADARLTPNGKYQAMKAHEFFAKQYGLPPFESHYTSPLSRCLQTSNLTFNGLHERPFRPVVKEGLRERSGKHTCDRRSSLTHLRKSFPRDFISSFDFEATFSDKDPLWTSQVRESSNEVIDRVQKTLDSIFETDRGQWISITAHSGTFQAMLEIFGHRQFEIKEAGMIAVVVKATRVKQ